MNAPATLAGLPTLLVALHEVCPAAVNILAFGHGPEGTPGRRFDIRGDHPGTFDTGVHRVGDYRWHYVLSQLGDDGPFELAPWTLGQLQHLAQVLIREAGWVWRLMALESGSLRSRAEVLEPGTLRVCGAGEGEAECMALLAALVAARRQPLELPL